MYDYIVQIALFGSLAVIVYLFARALPRIDRPDHVRTANAFDRALAKLPIGKMDSAVNSFFERILRKMRVVIMKIDNFVNGYLNRLKEHQIAKEKQVDLREKMEAIKAEDISKKEVPKV